MEEAAGEQLGEIWDEMELSDKLKIVNDVVAFEKKFLSLSFTRSVTPKCCTCAGIANRNPQLWEP